MQWDPTLKQDLNKAVNAKIRNDPDKVVAALLLSWENKVSDLPEVEDEIRKLKETFKEAYGFEVTPWQIPGDQGNPAYLLEEPLIKFLRTYDRPGNLLIIYYGGHGMIENHDCIWTASENLHSHNTSGTDRQIEAKSGSPP